jgi:hypothetical protein
VYSGKYDFVIPGFDKLPGVSKYLLGWYGTAGSSGLGDYAVGAVNAAAILYFQ